MTVVRSVLLFVLAALAEIGGACHTSQAPPISAIAASTNNSTERTTAMT